MLFRRYGWYCRYFRRHISLFITPPHTVCRYEMIVIFRLLLMPMIRHYALHFFAIFEACIAIFIDAMPLLRHTMPLVTMPLRWLLTSRSPYATLLRYSFAYLPLRYCHISLFTYFAAYCFHAADAAAEILIEVCCRCHYIINIVSLTLWSSFWLYYYASHYYCIRCLLSLISWLSRHTLMHDADCIAYLRRLLAAPSIDGRLSFSLIILHILIISIRYAIISLHWLLIAWHCQY